MVILWLCCVCAPAQADLPSAPLPQTAPLPNESDAQRKARLHAEAEHEVKAEETQRILAVVPNFETVLNGRAVPLSPGQKAELAVRQAVDPFNFIGSFVLAGFSEVTDSDRGYGWGAAGYFKRAGANLADVVDATVLAQAVYPIAFHQDPRYFRMGSGPPRRRVRHALLSAWICHGDNGHAQPNLSNLLGNLTAGAISNAYYPANQRGPGLVFANAAIVTLEGSAGTLAVEFAPDFSTWLERRRARRATAGGGTR